MNDPRNAPGRQDSLTTCVNCRQNIFMCDNATTHGVWHKDSRFVIATPRTHIIYDTATKPHTNHDVSEY